MLLSRDKPIRTLTPHLPDSDALRLSVIVPLAPDEVAWPALIEQLASLPPASEVILACTEAHRIQRPPHWPAATGFRSVRCAIGRARQQNAAARCARGEWLWFLHADSRLSPDVLPTVQHFLDSGAEALAYFDLAYAGDGPRLAALNAWGANLRSRWLGLPFGDQGLLLPARRFAELGGYDESAACGEDHLLVWAARHGHLPLQRLAAPIRTSARKYARHGWLRTTLRNARLTAAQAWLASRTPRGKRP
mgnify:CR=1 FL=1